MNIKEQFDKQFPDIKLLYPHTNRIYSWIELLLKQQRDEHNTIIKMTLGLDIELPILVENQK